MKTKYIVYSILVVAGIVFIVYLFNAFQLRIEQAVGKFLSWLFILLLVFLAGWVLGRFGRHNSEKRKLEKAAAKSDK